MTDPLERLFRQTLEGRSIAKIRDNWPFPDPKEVKTKEAKEGLWISTKSRFKRRAMRAKVYLGDGVYAAVNNIDEIVLTTEDGISETNKIILERTVASALLTYLKANIK